MKDIETREDIIQMVNTFYSRVQKDELLGPIFNGKIQDRWETHLNTMYNFWSNILLGDNSYHGRPFPPHMSLPIDTVHFENWLAIFILNIDQQFKGPNVELIKDRAFSIANIFNHKIQMIRQSEEGHGEA